MPTQLLNIVITYRDRIAHLNQLMTQLAHYFTFDKVDKDIPYVINIVEQAGDDLFNGGSLKNIGFILGEKCGAAYTCFHDVDYLPIWADYSMCEQPGRIVWFGAENRPVRESNPTLTIPHNKDDFFGAVVLFPNRDYRLVNGTSNAYWGWGYEDVDLINRLHAKGIFMRHRDGFFTPLSHDNRGHTPTGATNAIATLNEQICAGKWSRRFEEQTPDGLAEVAYEIIDQVELEVPKQFRSARWTRSKVRLLNQSSSKHRAAAARDALSE